MDARLKTWMEEEMREFSGVLQEFNKKLNAKMPLWMAISVVGMVALGILVGGDVLSVLKLHFPIGCGIAVVIWFCFWVQGRSVNMKKVRASYEKAIGQFFKTEEDIAAFTRQMGAKNYGKVNFMNIMTDKYPCRFIVGPDYWLYFRDLDCRFIRAADIKQIYGKEEQTRVRYNAGNARVRQNVGVGVSLVAEYEEGSASGMVRREESMYLENGEQYGQVVELIRRYCPQRAGER